jgi:AraC-like DNA-binding protein
MAIGSMVGRERLEDVDQYQRAMMPATQLYDLFKKEIGHTLCVEIHKIRYGRVYRLSIPEERQAFHEMGGMGEKVVLRCVGLQCASLAEIFS